MLAVAIIITLLHSSSAVRINLSPWQHHSAVPPVVYHMVIVQEFDGYYLAVNVEIASWQIDQHCRCRQIDYRYVTRTERLQVHDTCRVTTVA